jgi:hypothetical protein
MLPSALIPRILSTNGNAAVRYLRSQNYSQTILTLLMSIKVHSVIAISYVP